MVMADPLYLGHGQNVVIEKVRNKKRKNIYIYLFGSETKGRRQTKDNIVSTKELDIRFHNEKRSTRFVRITHPLYDYVE